VKLPRVVQLAPAPEHPAALRRTLDPFNAACTASAGVACAQRMATQRARQPLVYTAGLHRWSTPLVSYDIRKQFGWSAPLRIGAIADMRIGAIAKVAQASKRDRPLRPLCPLRPLRPSVSPQGARTYAERLVSFPRVDRAWLVPLDGRVAVAFALALPLPLALALALRLPLPLALRVGVGVGVGVGA
jgi:hypothetical protein